MVDTIRSDADSLALLVIGGSGAISAQDVRDNYVSLAAKAGTSLRQFGAVGNGSTNDATAIQAAIDAASALSGMLGSQVLDGNGRTYRVDSTINLKSNVTIQNAIFNFSNVGIADILFGGGGTLGATSDINSAASPGDRSVTVVSTTGFAAGDWCLVHRTTNFGTESTGVVAEIVRILAVDSGTVMRIQGSLDYDYPTGGTAEVQKIAPLENIRFERCKFIGNPAQNQDAFRPAWIRNIVIRDCHATGWASRAFGFDGCWHVLIDQCFVDGGTADTLNYGVAFTAGCHYCTVRDSMMMDCRHAVTTGGMSYVNRHIAVVNCRSIGSRDAAFDSHRDCDHYLIDGCVANPRGETGGDGIICQAARSTIVNNTIVGGHGGRHGIYVQMLTGYTGIQPCTNISNNRIVGNGGSGIFVDNQSATATGSVTIVGNHVRPTFGASGEVYVNGIELHADVSAINRVVITGNELSEISGIGILLRNDSGLTISDGVINSNQISMTGDSSGVRAIHLNGTAAGDIQDFAINGNMCRNGQTGILGTNTNRIMVAGNVVTSATTPITVAGAATVIGDNVI